MSEDNSSYCNFETYSLIWLDASINSGDNIETQAKFRSFINHLQIFENPDQCEQHIRSVLSQDRIVFVVSGSLGIHLVPKIHSLQQIFSIYIYCANLPFHREWAQHYIKVKSVCDQFNDLINRIQCDHSDRRQNKSDEPLSMSIFDKDNDYEQSTTGLDGRFLQTQLLITCLIKMRTTSTDKDEFILKCREIYKGNDKQLIFIDEFEREYVDEHSLWWYSRETFLYRLLNKALRIQNIDFLFLFRFFIRDIENQLYENRYLSPTRVYRGQLISLDELNILKRSQNKLISVNSFLSTSLNRQTALFFLGSFPYNDTYERVLFEIDADPRKDGVKPFADLSKFNCFPEEEFLMTIGSVFYLKNIYLGENRIWHIEMELCGNIDGDLHNTFHHLQNQYSLNSRGLLEFGNLLIDMAYFDHAEKYFGRLLKQLTPQHKNIYKCYHGLAKICCEKGNYDLSIDYLNQSLASLKNLKLNDSRTGYIYNSMGEAQQKKGDINQALQSYEKALKIFKKTFKDDDENIAWCYNNLGIIYQDKKQYKEARKYLNKALIIKLKHLPPKHPCLANTYNNLGNIHYYFHEYDKALEMYQLSYEILSKSMTPVHPSIARLLMNIGIIYETKQNFSEAKMNYEKAHFIRTKVLSSTHPDLIHTKNDIIRLSLIQ
ncbi:unnamed protein product [Adineta steineri]|uniref:Uncharacterized protein n=1 Tax=Adineta steineri TaxID=433720 RepID=A0A818TWV9_9BILA|nr:unnamed protein product [Adineta steineri]CAF3693200.1 unnamed protein product [Adineta steineri]